MNRKTFTSAIMIAVMIFNLMGPLFIFADNAIGRPGNTENYQVVSAYLDGTLNYNHPAITVASSDKTVYGGILFKGVNISDTSLINDAVLSVYYWNNINWTTNGITIQVKGIYGSPDQLDYDSVKNGITTPASVTYEVSAWDAGEGWYNISVTNIIQQLILDPGYTPGDNFLIQTLHIPSISPGDPEYNYQISGSVFPENNRRPYLYIDYTPGVNYRGWTITPGSPGGITGQFYIFDTNGTGLRIWDASTNRNVTITNSDPAWTFSTGYSYAQNVYEQTGKSEYYAILWNASNAGYLCKTSDNFTTITALTQLFSANTYIFYDLDYSDDSDLLMVTYGSTSLASGYNRVWDCGSDSWLHAQEFMSLGAGCRGLDTMVLEVEAGRDVFYTVFTSTSISGAKSYDTIAGSYSADNTFTTSAPVGASGANIEYDAYLNTFYIWFASYGDGDLYQNNQTDPDVTAWDFGTWATKTRFYKINSGTIRDFDNGVRVLISNNTAVAVGYMTSPDYALMIYAETPYTPATWVNKLEDQNFTSVSNTWVMAFPGGDPLVYVWDDIADKIYLENYTWFNGTHSPAELTRTALSVDADRLGYAGTQRPTVLQGGPATNPTYTPPSGNNNTDCVDFYLATHYPNGFNISNVQEAIDYCDDWIPPDDPDPDESGSWSTSKKTFKLIFLVLGISFIAVPWILFALTKEPQFIAWILLLNALGAGLLIEFMRL